MESVLASIGYDEVYVKIGGHNGVKGLRKLSEEFNGGFVWSLYAVLRSGLEWDW